MWAWWFLRQEVWHNRTNESESIPGEMLEDMYWIVDSNDSLKSTLWLENVWTLWKRVVCEEDMD